MGLFDRDTDAESDTTDESSPNTFEPIATDGNRVLGYFTDGSDMAVVWVNSQEFDKIDPDRIDDVV